MFLQAIILCCYQGQDNHLKCVTMLSGWMCGLYYRFSMRAPHMVFVSRMVLYGEWYWRMWSPSYYEPSWHCPCFVSKAPRCEEMAGKACCRDDRPLSSTILSLTEIRIKNIWQHPSEIMWCWHHPAGSGSQQSIYLVPTFLSFFSKHTFVWATNLADFVWALSERCQKENSSFIPTLFTSNTHMTAHTFQCV